jgi:hypothetical protein
VASTTPKIMKNMGRPYLECGTKKISTIALIISSKTLMAIKHLLKAYSLFSPENKPIKPNLL